MAHYSAAVFRKIQKRRNAFRMAKKVRARTKSDDLHNNNISQRPSGAKGGNKEIPPMEMRQEVKKGLTTRTEERRINGRKRD